MKKIFKVVLVLLVVVAVALAALIVRHFSNIKALLTAYNHSENEINVLVEQREEQTNKILSDLAEYEINIPTEAEMQKYENGEMSKEAFVSVITNTESPDKVSEIISDIYILRAEFTKLLSDLESDFIAAANAIPKSERTLSKKLDIVETYTNKGVALEKQCDAKMKVLMSQLEAELKKEGKDTQVVSEIKSFYEKEKEIKKSQLLSKYK